MPEFDVGSIVPSTRDLLQVVATKRRSLALIAVIGVERPAEDAARLADLNVSAFAFAEPGPAMALGARSTKTVPVLSLAPSGDRDACLAARLHGADGVLVDASLPDDVWDRLAKGARTMRMLPLALATDAETVARAVKAGARAVLVRGKSAADVIEASRGAPRSVTIVAEIVDADEAAVRAMVGHADAVIVPESLHLATTFESLVAEVDP